MPRRQVPSLARPAGKCPIWNRMQRPGANTGRRSTRICHSVTSSLPALCPTAASVTYLSRGCRYSMRPGASSAIAASAGTSPIASGRKRRYASCRASWRTPTHHRDGSADRLDRHEVAQPIAASITNANAALALAGRRPTRPRGSAAIARTRYCGTGSGPRRSWAGSGPGQEEPPRKSQFDLNETVREVIALTRSELHRSTASHCRPSCPRACLGLSPIASSCSR